MNEVGKVQIEEVVEEYLFTLCEDESLWLISKRAQWPIARLERLGETSGKRKEVRGGYLGERILPAV